MPESILLKIWLIYFKDKPIAAIYISSYLRTKQTIAPVAEHLQLVPAVDSRLNEIDNGAVGDMSEKEFQLAWPEEWRAFADRKADFRYPGGESGAEVQARIREFLMKSRGSTSMKIS